MFITKMQHAEFAVDTNPDHVQERINIAPKMHLHINTQVNDATVFPLKFEKVKILITIK